MIRCSFCGNEVYTIVDQSEAAIQFDEIIYHCERCNKDFWIEIK